MLIFERHISFNKKHDPANSFVPGLFIPIDRGRTVFKNFLTLLARPFYGGIYSIFPSGQKIFTTEFQCDDKDRIKGNLEALFNNLQKEGVDLKDFSLKLKILVHN